MDTLDKRRVLWWLLLASLISGVTSFLLRDSPETQRATTSIGNLIFALGLARWFVLDARLHAYRMPHSLFLYMMICSVFAVPYYFARTRRRDAWKSLFKSLGFYAVTVVLQLLVYLSLEVATEFSRLARGES